jgi:hypothetical protein
MGVLRKQHATCDELLFIGLIWPMLREIYCFWILTVVGHRVDLANAEGDLFFLDPWFCCSTVDFFLFEFLFPFLNFSIANSLFARSSRRDEL